jgi:fumarate reductase subunit C
MQSPGQAVWKPTAPNEGILDVAQMATGVALILFMWSHMMLVASVNLGSGVMNAIGAFLEDHYLAQLGGPAVALLFLLHFALAARKIPFRAAEQSAMWQHSVRFRHTDTWLWVVQAVTGMLILVMGCIHMWTVLTNLPITAGKSAFRVQGGWWLLFYMVLLPAVELHVGIGLYRIAVKWGFATSRQRTYLKSLENRITVGFIVVGVITLFTFYVIISASMKP